MKHNARKSWGMFEDCYGRIFTDLITLLTLSTSTKECMVVRH